jgi:hypothetical protein
MHFLVINLKIYNGYHRMKKIKWIQLHKPKPILIIKQYLTFSMLTLSIRVQIHSLKTMSPLFIKAIKTVSKIVTILCIITYSYSWVMPKLALLTCYFFCITVGLIWLLKLK